ncbi:hypothetical protein K9L67_03655 [Candidatus Woesearchaeota archaeon]|nr:hypothetical protein [Candidatus Woesearchaeota archaeon]MCF7901297.1 hypothetical protein [Candidatus Woesearchaeota archaeon]MCF8013797.1 hypothetical protein [Candidatus Woesearchaeota archaeon]
MKKGDMSINIIVIAAIALLVLVILSILLFRSGSGIREGTSCTGTGGTCWDEPTCQGMSDYSDTVYRPNPNGECPENQYCCIQI